MISAVKLASELGQWGATRSKPAIALFCFALVSGVGYIDYVTGIQVSLSVVYVVPITVAAWFVNRPYAFVLAAFSAALWIFGDMAGGMQYTTYWVPVWNGFIRLSFYAFLIIVLGRLHDLQRDLGRRVQERAAALTKEIAERERLERELLEVSERERRRIGQDLHDGLCQHLTGTALASQVLAQKLASRNLQETNEAQLIVDLVEEAISLARGVAKGLHPVEMQADGLMQALDEFAAKTSELFKVSCKFECDSPVLMPSPTIATHLFRIAQEAASNAIKHGQATRIVISLEAIDAGLRLCISDNGSGIPDPVPNSGGMGLRIIADRAKVIGAKLAIRRSMAGGAEISCMLSQVDIPAHLHHA